MYKLSILIDTIKTIIFLHQAFQGKTDLTKKTVGLHCTGGNPSFAPDKPAAVANPPST